MNHYNCPQCGEQTKQLFEGYCNSCCHENQVSLDLSNAELDRWLSMTDEQRTNEINRSIKGAKS